MPATCVPWLESSSENATARARGGRALRREDPRDDHLRRREALLALRKSGRHRVAGRVEEGVTGVDPRVDDPDLHTLPRSVERPGPTGRAPRSAAVSRTVAARSCRRGERREHREGCAVVEGRSWGGRARSRSRRAGSASRSRRPGAGQPTPAGTPAARPRSPPGSPVPAPAAATRAARRPPCCSTGIDGPTRREQNGDEHNSQRRDSCHRRLRRPEARIGRPRGCGGIGRRARFRSVCP